MQPNVGGVRIVHSNATSTYNYITVRVGKHNIKLLVYLGAKASILHKSFYFAMKPRPYFDNEASQLLGYSSDFPRCNFYLSRLWDTLAS